MYACWESWLNCYAEHWVAMTNFVMLRFGRLNHAVHPEMQHIKPQSQHRLKSKKPSWRQLRSSTQCKHSNMPTRWMTSTCLCNLSNWSGVLILNPAGATDADWTCHTEPRHIVSHSSAILSTNPEQSPPRESASRFNMNTLKCNATDLDCRSLFWTVHLTESHWLNCNDWSYALTELCNWLNLCTHWLCNWLICAHWLSGPYWLICALGW